MKISPRELREAQIPSKAFGFNQDVVDALLERAADTIEGLIEENRQLFEALERLRSEGSSTQMADPFADVEPVVHEEPATAPEPVSPAASIDESILLAQVSEKEELINKTLLLAQKTADETLKTAKEQATQLVTEAEEKAAQLVEQAELNAQNLTGEAQEKAQAELLAAQEQAQNLIAAAQGQADELVSEAQKQADSIHAEERNRFVELVTQLRNERAQLLSDIEILQGFDSQHRTKLRDLLESDLAMLQTRERVDVGAIPELPQLDPVPVPASNTQSVSDEAEVVAHSEETPAEVAQSFDEMMAGPAEEIEPEVQEEEILEGEHDVLVSEDIEVETFDDIVEVAPAGSAEQSYSTDDPFAAFVEAPAASADDGIIDAQVVEPASDEVTSSGPSGAFDPGSKAKTSGDLDDDDFFASLREAVQDDTPLGPDDHGDERSKRKGKSKK